MRRTAGFLVLLFVLPAGDGRADERAAGRVLRIEAPRRDEVRVPAGKFWLGIAPNMAQAAAEVCKRIYPSPEVTHPNTGARINFCEDYMDDLAKMEPREVFLDAYAIDRDEVTVSAYRNCVAVGACDLDPLVAGDERYIRDEWPMVNVTWNEAQSFCRWRGGRLPTEAEWERAARGDDPAATWPWGDSEQTRDFNHGQARDRAMREIERNPSTVPLQFFGDPDDSDGAALLAPPGSYVWGEGPFGTRDQAGNVAEWTADAFGTTERTRGYTQLPNVNPLRDATTQNQPRIVRGGSWRQPAFVARSNLRDPFAAIYEANRRFAHVGFRCARSNARPGDAAAPLRRPVFDWTR